MENYLKIPDWLCERKDLSWQQKAVIAQIMRYGDNGNFQTNSSLARSLGFADRRSVIRMIGKLVRNGWLAPIYESSQRRILYADLDKIKSGEPLLADCGKPVGFAVKSAVKSCEKKSGTGDRQSPVERAPVTTTGDPESPLFNRKIVQSSIVHSIEDPIVQTEVSLAADAIEQGDVKPGLSQYERNKRINKIKDQVDQMRRESI